MKTIQLSVIYSSIRAIASSRFGSLIPRISIAQTMDVVYISRLTTSPYSFIDQLFEIPSIAKVDAIDSLLIKSHILHTIES